MTTSATDLFVGRESEMAELRASLDDARAGRGRMVMLAGEPGIGKTTMAEAIATIGAGQGFTTLWGRCPEQRGAPPYWPWAQIIRSSIAHLDGDSIRKAMASHADVIAEVVPEVAKLASNPDQPRAISDLDSARFRLHDAFARFLREIAEDGPLILILDDLHWADDSSLRLLEFVVQELTESQILILGTYRDSEVTREHPLFHTLGDLSRRRLFSRIAMGGLSVEGVEAMLAAETDKSFPTNVSAAIHKQTEGNPLFVSEMIRYLGEENLLTGNDTLDLNSMQVGLPEGIREVIGRRLSKLSVRANDVLTNAAFLGREFSLPALQELSLDTNESEVLNILDEAIDARLIERLQNQVDQYQFSHALIQQTLTDAQSTVAKAQLHARIANVLEKLYEEEADSHVGEILLHLSEAGSLVPADRTVHYALAAGTNALNVYSTEEAQSAFELGLESLDDENGEIAAALRFGLGRAQASNLPRIEIQKAVDNLTRAFDMFLDSGMADAAVEVALFRFPPVQGPTGLAKMLDRALELVSENDPEYGYLLGHHALWISSETGEYERAVELLEASLQSAIANDDLPLQMQVHAHAVTIHNKSLNEEKSQKSARAVIELSETVGDLGSLVPARFARWRSLVDSGDADRVKEQARLALATAEKLQNSHHLTTALHMNTESAALTGDWIRARKFSDRALENDPTEPRVLRARIGIEASTGHLDAAGERLSTLRDLAFATDSNLMYLSNFAMAAAIYTHSTGDLMFKDDVARSVQAIENIGTSADKLSKILAFTASTLLSVVEGDDAKLRQGLSQLAENAVLDPSFQIFVAIVAMKLGETQMAVDRFQIAFDKSLFPVPRAVASFPLSLALSQSDAPGDREKATELVHEFVGLASELGLVLLEKQLIKLRGKIESSATPKSAHPDGLTSREVEVLRLLAAGNTNREIARDLVLSERTVQRHISNLYNKIGARNRVEATSYALNKLADPADSPEA